MLLLLLLRLLLLLLRLLLFTVGDGAAVAAAIAVAAVAAAAAAAVAAAVVAAIAAGTVGCCWCLLVLPSLLLCHDRGISSSQGCSRAALHENIEVSLVVVGDVSLWPGLVQSDARQATHGVWVMQYYAELVFVLGCHKFGVASAHSQVLHIGYIPRGDCLVVQHRRFTQLFTHVSPHSLVVKVISEEVGNAVKEAVPLARFFDHLHPTHGEVCPERCIGQGSLGLGFVIVGVGCVSHFADSSRRTLAFGQLDFPPLPPAFHVLEGDAASVSEACLYNVP